MLQHGIGVNARYQHGLTATMWAAGQGYAETVQLLVESGADVKLQDDRGKTAADMARDAGQMNIVSILQAAAH
jgi:hypothetical protein